ncbi:MAG: TIGR02444 family protein [Gammaproteobacteria bacterium]|nr:TIGR02444 family protein [Gammaproteobacteria bacterium]
MGPANSDLWEFSLKLYAEPGVAASCLSLQNRHGFDVNLVLFCIWSGFRHGELTDDLLKTALETSDRWRETVVQPLRSLRTRLKRDLTESAYSSSSEISALRERIETAELDAERIQQQELEKLIVPATGKRTAYILGERSSRRNLDKLAASLGATLNNAVSEHFDSLVKVNRRLVG